MRADRGQAMKIKSEAEQIIMLKEALQNIMGIYNTPLSRRIFPPDDFMKECLMSAEDALNYYKELEC